jgi:hypothetical protein
VTYFVYAVFEESKAVFVSTWISSWEARGWTARILSAREVEEAGDIRKAARWRGNGPVVDLATINFSLPAKRGAKMRTVSFGKRGWTTAGLVRFHNSGDIFLCGRTLWH